MTITKQVIKDVKYFGQDKYGSHKFGLSEEQYKEICFKLDFYESIPLSHYEYKGKMCYTLNVKEGRVPETLTEKLKYKTMNIFIGFFEWEFNGKIGVSCRVDSVQNIRNTSYEFNEMDYEAM